MKQLTKSILFLSFAVFLFSCSSDDSSSSGGNTFKVNNETFTMQPSGGIILLNQDLISQNMKRSSFTVTGLMGTSKTASVSFDLFRKPTESISGTYTIYDTDDASSDDIETFIQTNNRGCLGWTSSLQVVNIATQQILNSANNPTTAATITIIDNGNNSYTIQYNGNYRNYNDDFVVTGTVPVEMNVTGIALGN
ncbi:hypothetical protein WMW71_05855 [Flavobacterium buctense]|uniref:Lipoprotein n=1 Tax=Flavobacterium buctense TaxID=1648146 RepID=A0ABU9DZN0_9FLAO|nr:hypothetical protein [Flavobacterium buctense]